MRMLLFLSVTLICAQLQAQVISESSIDIGFGFRKVYQEVKMPSNHWEGIGHFIFLYYRDVKLSQTSVYSISPDGEYAIFQDGPDGHVILFEARTNQKKIIHQFSGEFVKNFEWELSDHRIQIRYSSGLVEVAIFE